MIIERQQNGSLLISDIVNNKYIKKVYYFYILIIVLFITNEMDKRKKDREQWLSNQLSKSFEKGKNENNSNYN